MRSRGAAVAEDLWFVWYRRIVPLLQEYFYNDGPRLQAVLGREFIRTAAADADLFDDPPDGYDSDMVSFEVETFDWVIGAATLDGGPVNDGSAAGDGVAQVRLLKDLFESGTGAAVGEKLIASEF